MFFYKYLLLMLCNNCLNADFSFDGNIFTSTDLKILKRDTNGMFFTENDYITLSKLLFIMYKSNGMKKVNMNSSMLSVVVNNYSGLFSDKEVMCDKNVVFYVIPNTTEKDFLQKIKNEKFIKNGDIHSSLIVEFLNNSKYESNELPLTIFKKKTKSYKCDVYSFIQKGNNLLFVVKIEKSVSHSMKESFLQLAELLNFQYGAHVFDINGNFN